MKLPELPVKPELTPVVVIGLIVLLTILAVGGIFFFAGFFNTTTSSGPTADLAVSNQSSGSSFQYTVTISNLSLSSVNITEIEIVLNVSTGNGSQVVILQYNGNDTLGSSAGVNAYWYASAGSGTLKDSSSIQIAYKTSPGFGGSISSTSLYGPLKSLEIYVLGSGGGELGSQSA